MTGGSVTIVVRTKASLLLRKPMQQDDNRAAALHLARVAHKMSYARQRGVRAWEPEFV